jgi:hypothetical protein
MTKIHVRGGKPLAAYRPTGVRIVVPAGDFEAGPTEHTFPQRPAPEAALEILNAQGVNSLFVKCEEYTNEIEWDQFPDGGAPYFVPA